MGCNFSKTCPPQEFVGAWRGVQVRAAQHAGRDISAGASPGGRRPTANLRAPPHATPRPTDLHCQQDGGVIVGLIIHKQGTYEYAREGPNQHLRARGPINR